MSLSYTEVLLAYYGPNLAVPFWSPVMAMLALRFDHDVLVEQHYRMFGTRRMANAYYDIPNNRILLSEVTGDLAVPDVPVEISSPRDVEEIDRDLLNGLENPATGLNVAYWSLARVRCNPFRDGCELVELPEKPEELEPEREKLVSVLLFDVGDTALLLSSEELNPLKDYVIIAETLTRRHHVRLLITPASVNIAFLDDGELVSLVKTNPINTALGFGEPKKVIFGELDKLIDHFRENLGFTVMGWAVNIMQHVVGV